MVIAFLESYGKVAVQDSDFTAGVAQVLEEGGAQLARDGYSAQSAFLTSPTFGGVSWLAHSTLQSGVWVDSQQKYDRLITSNRLTLTRAFKDAGWRTVAAVPSNTEPWPQGTAFYGYDVMLNSRNMGYRGPTFSYARIPDQYTWNHLYERELSGAHAPVMAEVDFVSSHTPWTPVPRLVPWSEIGDGSVFDPQPAEGLAPVAVWPDERRVRSVYGQSVEYTLGAMFSFLHTYDQPNLVLVVLGDHQPARIVERHGGGSRCADHHHLEGSGGLRGDRLVAVGDRRPPVAGGADLADGSVPRPVLGGVRRLTPPTSDVVGCSSVVCMSRVVVDRHPVA